MPTGVYKRTEEARKNIANAHKGLTPWNKGKKGLQHHTEEWKKEQSKYRTEHPIKFWLGKKRPECVNFLTFKGRKHTEEWKIKMREILKEKGFKKGHIPYNKGLKRPGIGGKPKGLPAWNKGKNRWWKSSSEFKKGHINWNKGKKGVIKAWNRGKKCPQLGGENHPNWKGGITPEYVKERNKLKTSIEYRLWREAIFSRDNWTCQKCKIKGGILHPHHIQNWSSCKELRTSIENGITLCAKCHMLFHKIYGKINNNKEQIIEFLNI